MSDAVVIGLTLAIMLVGLVGVIVPVLPGVILVGIAAIGSTFVLGIDGAGWFLVVVLAFITLVGAGASYALPARKGLKSDVARSSLALAGGLGLVGFFVIPVVGVIVGALGGLYLGEVNRHGDRDRAWVSTRGVLKAYGVGVLVELIAAILLIVTWLVGTVVRL